MSYVESCTFSNFHLICFTSSIVSMWVVVTNIVDPSHFYVQYLAEARENMILSKKISFFCSKESSCFTSKDVVETGTLWPCINHSNGLLISTRSFLSTVLFRNTSHTSGMYYLHLFCLIQAQWFLPRGSRACGAGPMSSGSFRGALQRL